MTAIRDFLAGALGNSMGLLAWAALIAGGILLLVALSNIIGEKKNFQAFVISLVLSGMLIYVFLWIKQPWGLFSGTSFSQ